MSSKHNPRTQGAIRKTVIVKGSYVILTTRMWRRIRQRHQLFMSAMGCRYPSRFDGPYARGSS
jgi:hypothetical protein